MMDALPLFDTPETRRESVERHFASNHPAYIEHLRAVATDFARKHGRVTIDDLRDEMHRLSIPFPLAIGVTERIFGGVLFRAKTLKAVGQELTRRPERIAEGGVGASHITVYRLADEEAA
jgi:hypothetical protein